MSQSFILRYITVLATVNLNLYPAGGAAGTVPAETKLYTFS